MNKLAINRLTVNSIHVNNINVNALQKGLLTGSDSVHVDPTRPVIWNPEIQFSNPADSYVFQIWNGSTWEDMVTGQSYAGQSLFRLIVNTTGMDEVSAAVYNSSYMRLDIEATSEHQYVFEGNLNDVTPQQFTVTVDIFIRFEDIVQPYPLFFEFTDEHNNLVSWGNKVRVGSTITRTKGVAYANLLEGLFTITNPRLNGVPLASAKHVVEKQMVFTCTATCKLSNEPKSILSPRLLRIPNSSYKILSHIPDISGHGNHGVIHNSAYEGMSGANGYPYDYENSSFWADSKLAKVISGELVEYFAVKNSTGFSNITSGVYKGEIKVIGVNKAISENKISQLRVYSNSSTDKEIVDITQDGIYDINIKGVDNANRVYFYAIPNNPNESTVVRLTEPIRIKQVGKYEGAYCFDGVDDFVTIPTVSGGGKQVFMKIYNSDNRLNRMLYDQRSFGINGGPNNDFALYTESGTIAYKARNNGKTYIDGILNENITCNDLLGISQNITIVNTDVVPNNGIIPYIGSGGVNKNLWAKIALYDFMLFDEISTDDKIKELNEYVGIEGNVFEFNPPMFTIDLPMAIKSINVYQGGNEIRPGYLYPNKDTEFEVYVSLNDGKYAVDTITVDGVEITKDRVVGEYNIFKFTLNGSSEQKITIHSYEYIMYEDINQPYPVIFKVKDRTTNQTYSWGDRIKIGSSIRLIHGENPNLLPELYSIISYIYEGNSYSYNQLSNLVITVTKTISVSCQKTWKLGNNEPKCILSPKRLKLANSSYKYLGYIPDISGHGNHGLIYNSAYAEGSGVNEDGSYQFDGVDDFVSIPTLSIGGKQVLMKTNWLKSPALLYDQRASGGFAILTTNEDDATNPRIAYQARNQDGKTYIDGIENNYIETYSLKGIVHNITVTNPSAGSGVVPVIGANTGKSNSFAKMALYDFMLFDEISTDEEIKRLNDIVGIEGGYVQKPPYYWDAYGKTNSDDDRSTIRQRGTAVGDYDLTNHNHAYEGMSGYNGYPIILSGTNRTYQDKASYVNVVGDDKNIISITRISFTTAAVFSYIKQNGTLTDYNRNIESFKVKVTGLQYDKFVVKYNYINSVDATARTVISITSDGIYELPKSFASDGSLTSDNVWIGLQFTKQSADMPDIIEDVNVTIEVLPEYENGLAYDGEDDYSENINIPAFTDYTYIIKYEDFNNPNTGSCIQRKGGIKAGGGAFVQDHVYNGTKYQYNFGINNNIHKDDSIAFCTKTNYNGTAIRSGSNTDDTGLTIGKFDGYRKMVFYKEMLYPRTVNMLTINMIKNMMEEDRIIDLTHPVFITV